MHQFFYYYFLMNCVFQNYYFKKCSYKIFLNNNHYNWYIDWFNWNVILPLNLKIATYEVIYLQFIIKNEKKECEKNCGPRKQIKVILKNLILKIHNIFISFSFSSQFAFTIFYLNYLMLFEIYFTNTCYLVISIK